MIHYRYFAISILLLSMFDSNYFNCTLNALSLDTDFVELCKLYGQINKYTNLTADLTYLERFKAIYGVDLIKCIETSNYNRYQRLKRFRKYVFWCLNTDGYCLFVTLTFDDEMLSKSFAYRKKQVQIFLKSCSPYYLANVDFGSKNEREHYHALLYFPYEKEYQSFLSRCVLKSKGIYISKEWKYWNEFILCKSGKDDVTRLSKYVTKLSNHAFKDSTKSSTYRTIYSDSITILNKLLNESKRNPLFLTDSIASNDLIRGVVVRSCLRTNYVTTRAGVVFASDLKEAYLKQLMYQYQWKPYGDTFKPCDSENEYIDSEGNMISMNDLPF